MTPEGREVALNDLVGVDIHHLLDVLREEHVEEEDLVPPYEPLLLSLEAQVTRPVVRDDLDLGADGGGEASGGVRGAEGGREEVAEQPELERTAGALRSASHHDPKEALVQRTTSEREAVDVVIVVVGGIGGGVGGTDGGAKAARPSLAKAARGGRAGTDRAAVEDADAHLSEDEGQG